ncbi:MAG: CdaR family protein [Candidatus Limnocylindria bacterium]
MGILLRNWHLKLGALALATILYTGLVFSGSFSEGRVQVPVTAVDQPGNTFVLSGDLATVQVTYRVARTAGAIAAESFRATVDLSEYDMDRAPEPQVLNINVTALAEGVSDLTWTPETVTMQLDQLEAKEVLVEVDYGEVPESLEIGDPAVNVERVQVRGPASQVTLVDRAIARVRIDPSGIDVRRQVALEPVDVRGQPVASVDLSPAEISVEIDVNPVETTRTVPVRPDVSGTPAPGFAVTSLEVDPAVVTLRGLPEVLAETDEVLTEPISIEGLAANQTFTATLTLPEGTRLDDASAEGTVSVTATIEPSVSSRTFVTGVVCVGAGDNACLPRITQVSVTLSGPGALLSGLTAEQITPVADVTGLAPGQHQVTLVLQGLPEGVEVQSLSPTSVTVTIQAPATPAPTPAP